MMASIQSCQGTVRRLSVSPTRNSMKVRNSRNPTWTERRTIDDSGLNAAVMIWKKQNAIAAKNTTLPGKPGSSPTPTAGFSGSTIRRDGFAGSRTVIRLRRHSFLAIEPGGARMDGDRHAGERVLQLDRLCRDMRGYEGVEVLERRLGHLVDEVLADV